VRDDPALSASRLAASDATTRSLVMLHGIYGRGRNWQAIARGVIAARAEYACWLVDLPHHGDSGPGRHGDTVAGLAADVIDWMQEIGLVPDVVLGHSYGGKVALAMSPLLAAQPLQIWVIDSTPEVRPPSGSAWSMLQVIRGLPRRFPTREAAVAGLAGGGFSVAVAQWMSTNLVRDGDGFSWRLDFAVMERLLQDFFRTDLWAAVESPPAAHVVHVLKASESNAISQTALRRLKAAAKAQVHVHQRTGGHWIHAEAPAVVTELLLAHLP
jgi:pimeloyl-ACP methyl ester carboxylesterase